MLKLFRKTYTNRREAEIDLFFKYVNWYKLLKVWGLFPTFKEASDTILEYKKKSKLIKETWQNNPNKSLPQILSLLGILPLRYIKAGSQITDWYWSDIHELFAIIGLPEAKKMITIHHTYIFGIKRKNTIYTINKLW